MVMGATLRPFIGGLRASPMRERPTQSASLCLSVPLPLHPCISEWFLSRRRRRNTLLRRQLKKKQAVLLDASSPSRPPLSAYEDCLCLHLLLLPIVVSQPESSLASSKFPKQAAFSFLPFLAPLRPPCAFPPAVGVKIPRSGLGAALQPPPLLFLLGVGPARFSGARGRSSSQVWVLVAPLALRQRLPVPPPRVRWVAKKGRRERDGDGLSLPCLTHLAWMRVRVREHRILIPSLSCLSLKAKGLAWQRSCANAASKKASPASAAAMT